MISAFGVDHGDEIDKALHLPKGIGRKAVASVAAAGAISGGAAGAVAAGHAIGAGRTAVVQGVGHGLPQHIKPNPRLDPFCHYNWEKNSVSPGAQSMWKPSQYCAGAVYHTPVSAHAPTRARDTGNHVGLRKSAFGVDHGAEISKKAWPGGPGAESWDKAGGSRPPKLGPGWDMTRIIASDNRKFDAHERAGARVVNPRKGRLIRVTDRVTGDAAKAMFR